MSIKPKVFPSKEEIEHANNEMAKIEMYESEKLKATDEIYVNSINQAETSESYANAIELMKQRSLQQLEESKTRGEVVDPRLAEPTKVFKQPTYTNTSEEQIKLRDAQLQKNLEQTQNYQRLAEEASNRQYNTNNNNNNTYNEKMQENNVFKSEQNNYVPPVKPPVTYNTEYGQNPSNINPYIIELSQPNYNSPFDVIPLPSRGKTYRNNKANIKVSYMTTADENILTSPNLLQSGEFLSILINRKILEPELRYNDLLVGDRNAIMLWLRATGYGEMYPVTLNDENGIPFDTEINLNDLKTKELGAEPDEDGLFPYTFNISKANIRFKLLTCGDIDTIEKMIETDKDNDNPLNNTNTYTLEKTIVEVNGSRDRNLIKEFISNIRIKDAKDFIKYVNSIESGVDLNITIGTPGGGSIDTFLPLNIGFFWPDFGI